jgi:ATP-dependent Clp protease ATP-binding subunit ClpA
MPSFAQSLEKTLHSALANASERSHEYATLEHLLLALIDDADAAQVMQACGVDLGDLGDVVRQYLDQEYQSLKTAEKADPQPTAGFQRVIQRAILHVQSSGKDTVTGANVLVALFSERDSYAVYFLQQQDMSRLDAVSYISHGIGKGGARSIPARPSRPRKRPPSRRKRPKPRAATRRIPRSTSSASISTTRRCRARSIR